MTQLISNNNDSNDNKDNDETFISHLEALRTMLLNSIKAVLFLSPIGFWAAPKCINFLVNNSLPDGMTKLHYFAPMEVFNFAYFCFCWVIYIWSIILCVFYNSFGNEFFSRIFDKSN